MWRRLDGGVQLGGKLCAHHGRILREGVDYLKQLVIEGPLVPPDTGDRDADDQRTEQPREQVRTRAVRRHATPAPG